MALVIAARTECSGVGLAYTGQVGGRGEVKRLKKQAAFQEGWLAFLELFRLFLSFYRLVFTEAQKRQQPAQGCTPC